MDNKGLKLLDFGVNMGFSLNFDCLHGFSLCDAYSPANSGRISHAHTLFVCKTSVIQYSLHRRQNASKHKIVLSSGTRLAQDLVSVCCL